MNEDEISEPGCDRKSNNVGVPKNGEPYIQGKPQTYYSVVALARTYTFEALNTIMEIMMDEESPRSEKLAAARIILDRGWGRAPQYLEIKNAEQENPVIDIETKREALLKKILELMPTIKIHK